MSSIQFLSATNVVSYTGLIATLFAPNMDYNTSLQCPIPEMQHRMEICLGLELAPSFGYSDTQIIPVANNAESIILAVLECLLKVPSELDLKMANELNYDIGELF